eukprot:gene7806-8617_t
MKLSGPQSERDRLWGPRQSNQREDLLGKREEEKTTGMELTKLRTENKALRDQLQRAMRELHYYQVKYPSPYQPEKKDHEEDASVWSAKPEAVTPLLDAYDSHILELEDTIKQQAMKLDSFRAQVETLVRENEDLRNRLIHDISEGGGRLGPNGPLNAELLAELSDKVTILMEENSLLTDQKIKLHTELEHQSSALEQTKQQLLLVHNTVSEQDKELERLAQLLANVEKDRDEAVQQAVQVSEALGKAEQEVDAVTEANAILKEQHRQAERTIEELNKQVRLLSSRFHDDADQMVGKMRFAEDRVRELRLTVHQKSKELDQANEAMRKLRLEYKSTRQDAEGMLAVMTGMEKQLNEYASREESTAKLAAESREKIEEAVMIKEQCAVKEEQSRREIDRLLAERKALTIAQQDEIDAAVAAVRKVMQEQQQNLEKEIDALIQKNAKLLYESEHAQRDANSHKDLHNRTRDSFSVQLKSCEDAIATLKSQLQEALVLKEREAGQRKEMQDQNKDLRAMVDRYRLQMEQHKSQVSSLTQSFDADLQTQKLAVSDLQRDLSEKNRSLAIALKELEELRSHEINQSDQAMKKFSLETSQYVNKIQDYEALLNSLQKEMSQNEMKSQEQMEQLREKYKNIQDLMENRRNAEAEKNRQLLLKIRGLEVRLNEAEQERTDLLGTNQQLESKIQQMLLEQSQREVTIGELSQQLLASQHAREQGFLSTATAALPAFL